MNLIDEKLKKQDRNGKKEVLLAMSGSIFWLFLKLEGMIGLLKKVRTSILDNPSQCKIFPVQTPTAYHAPHSLAIKNFLAIFYN